MCVSGAAKALAELGTVECWVSKQANLMLSAISDLLADKKLPGKPPYKIVPPSISSSFPMTTGARNLRGCVASTYHHTVIHATIQKMKDQIKNTQKESDDWLNAIFRNWGLLGWASSLIKSLL